MENIYISIFGFLISISLVVLFYAKQRIKNEETSIFSALIGINFINIIIVLIYSILSYQRSDISHYLNILEKANYYFILMWTWLFFLYNFYISFFINSNKKNRYFIIKTITFTINMILTIFIFLLPIKNYQPAYNEILKDANSFIYISIAIYILTLIIILIVNIKKIFSKKYLALFLFIPLLIISFIVKTLNPQLMLTGAILAYIDMILFHIIENPDMEMLYKYEQAKDQAERANRAKTDFLSNMSHKMRTPLHVIVGLTDGLVENYKLEGNLKEDIEDIQSASNSLLEIVGNVLDLEKIENEQITIEEVDYDLYQELASFLKVCYLEKNNLRYSISSNLKYLLHGDKGKIK